MDINIIENDAIAFLGLMAIANKNFDLQYKHTDGEITHTTGLNIFAAIINNANGEVIGQDRNLIHTEYDPMLHAEQRTLKQAIAYLQKTNGIDRNVISAENYYRKSLFNQPNSVGNFNVGGTIYTTLEPCPFCTSALLVTRMKRIVYIIPDSTYGQSFNYLKETFYKSYDITYSNLKIPLFSQSSLINNSGEKLKTLIDYVQSYPEIATLYLDGMKAFLEECSKYFLSLTENDLITEGNFKTCNIKTLFDLQAKAQ